MGSSISMPGLLGAKTFPRIQQTSLDSATASKNEIELHDFDPDVLKAELEKEESKVMPEKKFKSSVNSTEPGAILRRGIKFENEKEYDEYMSNLNSGKKKKKKSPEKQEPETKSREVSASKNVKHIVQEFVPNPDFMSGIDGENSKSGDKNEDMETITSLVTDRVLEVPWRNGFKAC